MSFKICVVGDSIIDEYYSVKIKGVSPEFPIPVMQSFDSSPEVRPGGASNVAHQFAHFDNVSSFLISFLDANFLSLFHAAQFDTNLCVGIPGSVPIKRRFYSNGFPTYRWDVEKEDYGLMGDVGRFCSSLYSNLYNNCSKFHALIFSDYCKGVFKEFKKVPDNILTVVDSKSADLDKWFGCTVFKPNLVEALSLSGKSDALEAGHWIKSRIKCDHVVITNAEKGVAVVSKDGDFMLTPNSCKEAVSVIGAGDCFTAILTLSLLEGLHIKDAAQRAWKAGSVYVQKKYNSPILPLDLLEDKFISSPSLLSNRNFKLVFSNGCFDLIHAGHIENLKFAKSKGDKLVVALNDDESIGRLKPGRPIQTLQDRIKVISSFDFVDYIVSFSEDTPLNLIKEINPDVIVKGNEYGFHQVVGSDIIKEVFTFPMVNGLSTTGIIGKIRSFYDKSC